MNLWENPHFSTWVQRLPNNAAVEVRAAIGYLVEYGRGAQLDLVRHRIQISSNFPDMSEVRVLVRQLPHDLVLRVLTCFVDNDSTLLVCVAATRPNGRATDRRTGTTPTCPSPMRSSTITYRPNQSAEVHRL